MSEARDSQPVLATPYATHEVTNQPPALEDYNLFASDTALREGVAREGAGWAIDDLTAFVSDNEITNCDFNAIGFTSENTSQCTAQVHDNVMAGNQSGATFEVLATETAVFCLDLENNQNDDVYRFGIVTGAVVNVEELILSPTPSVPGNTGTVDIVTGGGFTDPTPQMDGFCGF